jgi:hypothetical protein
LLTPRSLTISEWRILRTLLLFAIITALYLGATAPQTVPAIPGISSTGEQFEGVAHTQPDQISLLPDAAQPPVGHSAYERYGFYISPIQNLQQAGSRITLRYDASVPQGSSLQLDLRVSQDGSTWSAWETNVADGATVDFPMQASRAQYRARLFGSQQAAPTLHKVQLATLSTPDTAHAAPVQDAVAPTYRIRGTRLGLVGWRTANGHIIQPRDRFVALPSWRSLSSRGGHEYQVRITYNGRSAVAPVWDVGPWNTRDDYWNADREVWKELPRGWPQDHAAYYDGHNGGYAEKGYVRFPTAIDIADGIWWDELGIHGDQAELEVTFLWLGRDPLAVPTPTPVPPPSDDPDAHEYMVDERGPAFHPNQATWNSWTETACGADEHAYWTLTVNDMAKRENKAFWNPDLAFDGLYDVYAFVPDCPNEYLDTQSAHYLIQHREGVEEVVIDQSRQKGWVLLGRFPFAANDSGFVYLSDLAGDAGHAIWFDNMKWIPIRE